MGVTFKGIDDEISFLEDFILIAIISTLLAEFEEISCYVVSKVASPKNHVASIECIPQPLVSKKLGLQTCNHKKLILPTFLNEMGGR